MLDVSSGSGNQAPAFYTRAYEVFAGVQEFMKSTHQALAPTACEDLVYQRKGHTIRFSGAVSLHRAQFRSDSHLRHRWESMLVLGSAAVGQDKAMSGVMSLLSDLHRLLGGALPRYSLHQIRDGRFGIVLPDGNVEVRANLGLESSSLKLVARLKALPPLS